MLPIPVLNSALNLKCSLGPHLIHSGSDSQKFRQLTFENLGLRESLVVFWRHENNHTWGLRLKSALQTKVCRSSLSLLKSLLESWGAARYLYTCWYSSCRNVRDPCTLWKLFEVHSCSQCVPLAMVPLFHWDLSGNSAPRGEPAIIFHSSCNKTTHTCPRLVVEKGQVVILCVLSQDLWLTKLLPLQERDLEQNRTCWKSPWRILTILQICRKPVNYEERNENNSQWTRTVKCGSEKKLLKLAEVKRISCLIPLPSLWWWSETYWARRSNTTLSRPFLDSISI